MTLEEHILKAEEDARTAESDAEWGIGNYFIDRTEAIEYAKECRNLVNWLKDYKRLLEQEPCKDCISREYMYKLGAKCIAARNENDELVAIASIESLSSVQPKTDIALERYKDLQDYFGDADVAKAILEDQKEFKAWLERLRWNTKKVDELARKLEALGQEPKTGHWIDRQVQNKIDGEIRNAMECSKCHSTYFRYDLSQNVVDDTPNYCPHCGAKIESECEHEQKTSQESI